MEAGIEGAGVERAFGVNIVLPFEAEAAPVIAGDPKLINYRYFFTRKLMFMKESHAYALLPGGFGTMDEAFELLTLMQTGRTNLAPVVMLQPAGGSYWTNWQTFVTEDLASRELINELDLCLARVCHDVDDAVDEVTAFYSTYHSSRYVGRRLVLRLKRELSEEELTALNDDFADIVVSGSIERVKASPSEVDDDDVVDLPRLAFVFDRMSYARLRLLIDQLNGRR
jgi:predicted Rossmann-fold nucleotide-binding protein